MLKVAEGKINKQSIFQEKLLKFTIVYLSNSFLMSCTLDTSGVLHWRLSEENDY